MNFWTKNMNFWTRFTEFFKPEPCRSIRVDLVHLVNSFPSNVQLQIRLRYNRQRTFQNFICRQERQRAHDLLEFWLYRLIHHKKEFQTLKCTNRQISSNCELYTILPEDRPGLVCQRRSEVVDFSGVLEAILKRLEIVVYLSTCLVDKSNLVRYWPQARAARKLFQYITDFLMDSLRRRPRA